MVKIFHASDNEPVKRAGYSAQYIADVVFREPTDTAGFILVRIPAGGRTKAHYHSDLEEVFIAMNSMKLGVGTEIYEMEEGDVALVEPGEEHWFEAPSTHDVTVVAVKMPNLKDDKATK